MNEGNASQTDSDIVMEEGFKVLEHDQDLKFTMLVGNDDSSKGAVEKHRTTLAAYEAMKEVVSMNRLSTVVDSNELLEEAGDALVAYENTCTKCFTRIQMILNSTSLLLTWLQTRLLLSFCSTLLAVPYRDT